MESAKRASGNNCVWNLNFFTFLKKRGEKQEGKEVKKKHGRGCSKNQSIENNAKSAIHHAREKSQKSFSFFFFRIYAWLRFQTHTHTHTHALRE